nr:hypothetical protein B0A51_13609 [Rachicladosporium sp. CCFEE 5018]
MPAPKVVPITVVVVGKRHNTRFFAPNDKLTYAAKNSKITYPLSSDGNKTLNGNVSPGFIVDSYICDTSKPADPAKGIVQDFFLQSHCALAGTARSAHYVVLRNDMKLSISQIYDLTHAFCYSYARATKGVSYCAPAYYADRLCDRVNRYLRVWSDENDVAVSKWEKNKAELAMSVEEGEKAFKMRIRNEVQKHKGWHHDRERRPGPWMSRLDEVMFWL